MRYNAVLSHSLPPPTHYHPETLSFPSPSHPLPSRNSVILFPLPPITNPILVIHIPIPIITNPILASFTFPIPTITIPILCHSPPPPTHYQPDTLSFASPSHPLPTRYSSHSPSHSLTLPSKPNFFVNANQLQSGIECYQCIVEAWIYH